jgi:hypothetical protein
LLALSPLSPSPEGKGKTNERGAAPLLNTLRISGGKELCLKARTGVRFRAGLTLWLRIPVSLALQEAFDPLLFEFFQVSNMGITMVGPQKVQFAAGLKITAFPATFIFFLLYAFPDRTERIPSPTVTPVLATQPDQRPQDLIALIVMFKFFERDTFGHDIEFLLPEFLPQLLGQIGNSPFVTKAVLTTKTTISNEFTGLDSHSYTPYTCSNSYPRTLPLP